MKNGFYRLYEKFLRGDITTKEFQKFKQTFNEMPDKALEAEMLIAWDSLLPEPQQTASIKIPFYKKAIFRISSIAAVLIVAISLSTIFFLKEHQSKEDIFTEVNTELGQMSQVSLPDGTKVWLNALSSLSYNKDYNHQKRIVNLKGEAFFEVAKDPSCPFIVETGKLSIEALGTSFNVKSYGSDHLITTTLLEGKVRINTESSSQTLLPNERFTFDKSNNTYKKSIVDALSSTHWRHKELVYSSESFENITADLERIYDVKFEFENPALKTVQFSGIIKYTTLEDILQTIMFTCNANYRMKDSTVVVIQSTKRK